MYKFYQKYFIILKFIKVIKICLNLRLFYKGIINSIIFKYYSNKCNYNHFHISYKVIFDYFTRYTISALINLTKCNKRNTFPY